jgi:hypothetical protein
MRLLLSIYSVFFSITWVNNAKINGILEIKQHYTHEVNRVVTLQPTRITTGLVPKSKLSFLHYKAFTSFTCKTSTVDPILFETGLCFRF